eukprot:scaffold32581_cov124-Isochrysis_galbana.AAC.4
MRAGATARLRRACAACCTAMREAVICVTFYHEVEVVPLRERARGQPPARPRLAQAKARGKSGLLLRISYGHTHETHKHKRRRARIRQPDRLEEHGGRSSKLGAAMQRFHAFSCQMLLLVHFTLATCRPASLLDARIYQR